MKEKAGPGPKTWRAMHTMFQGFRARSFEHDRTAVVPLRPGEELQVLPDARQ